nr:MAG: hypothetical protein [uncultured archaeon]
MESNNDREIEEDEEYNELEGRKEGSGQYPTSRNPKGAGRPSNIWRDFKDFGEWRAAVKAGLIPRDLSELIGRVADSTQGRGEGDSKPDYKGLLASIGEMMGLKKKDIEKFDIADEQIVRIYKELAPYTMPFLMKPALFFGGISGWYLLEHKWKKTEKMTQGEYDAFIKIRESRIITVEDITEGDKIYKVTYLFLPQILHTIEKSFNWVMGISKKWFKEEHDLTVLEFVAAPSSREGMRFVAWTVWTAVKEWLK